MASHLPFNTTRYHFGGEDTSSKILGTAKGITMKFLTYVAIHKEAQD